MNKTHMFEHNLKGTRILQTQKEDAIKTTEAHTKLQKGTTMKPHLIRQRIRWVSILLNVKIFGG